jgi:hypothetical protein
MRRFRKRVGALLAGGLRFPGYTPQWLAGQAALAAAVGLAASVLIELILLPSLWLLQFWQLWLLIGGGLLVRWTARPLIARPPPPPLAEDPSLYGLRDRPYPLADRWEFRLSVTAGDPEWYARVVRDRLTGLVAERVRQRHGVLPTGPEQARAVLGDPLHGFLTDPVTRTPSPAELNRLITRMEEI